MTTALIAIAKMENRYLRHWVEYNRCMGFSNIVLCDNNDIEGERFDEVISDYIESGFVIVEDYRGAKTPQIRAYNEMYRKYGDRYDWLAFLDCDEYLTLEECYKDLEGFLSQEKFDDFQGIKINWLCYGDNGLVEPDYSIPVTERFTEPSAFDGYNHRTKMFVRGGIDRIVFTSAHSLSVNCFRHKFCNIRGERVHPEVVKTKDICHETHIKHYITKTIVEYINKMKRGDVLNVLNNTNCKPWFNEYWHFNERTIEKESIANEFIK